MTKKKPARTSQALRDILFDEIEDLRSGNGDTQRAMAVANLSKQIIKVAQVELAFHRQMIENQEAGLPAGIGNMQLGSPDPVASAGEPVTEH